MRVVESAGFYYPDSIGGTEVYVNALARGLLAQGIETVVAAPTQATEALLQYAHEGVTVFRYPIPNDWRRHEIQGRAPHRFFEIFEDWLRLQNANIYHQHSWTTGCGLWHLHAAKRLGLKTILTVHVPANICMRGTMLLNGRVACDGEILPRRCASCWLQSKEVAPRLVEPLTALPPTIGWLARLPRVGPLLAAHALAVGRRQQIQEMAAAADRVIAVCEWLRDALRANGVPKEKLFLNRQGVAQLPLAKHIPVTEQPHVRIGFLGRWDPTKGLHILVDAFSRLPKQLKTSLYIRAADNGQNRNYREALEKKAAADGRIIFAPSEETVAEFFQRIEVLAVPSQWMETGPLVVLEAFASRIPVVGSDLGGIRELVSHKRNGLLIPHDDVAAWTVALSEIVNLHELRARFRAEIEPVRTMTEVARDMAEMYSELLSKPIGEYAQ